MATMQAGRYSITAAVQLARTARADSRNVLCALGGTHNLHNRSAIQRKIEENRRENEKAERR